MKESKFPTCANGLGYDHPPEDCHHPDNRESLKRDEKVKDNITKEMTVAGKSLNSTRSSESVVKVLTK